MAPCQWSIDALNTVTPHLADLLADGPPGQLSMDLWKTITPNNFHDRMTLALSPPIDHRSMEDHYTEYFWQMDPSSNSAWISGRPLHQIIFMTGWHLPPPPIDNRTMEDHYTEYFWLMDPPPIQHGSLEDHYTK